MANNRLIKYPTIIALKSNLTKILKSISIKNILIGIDVKKLHFTRKIK
jgi:hypothetical protein